MTARYQAGFVYKTCKTGKGCREGACIIPARVVARPTTEIFRPTGIKKFNLISVIGSFMGKDGYFLLITIDIPTKVSANMVVGLNDGANISSQKACGDVPLRVLKR